MIGEDRAAGSAAELLALPFPPESESLTRRLIRTLAERSTDPRHCERAVDFLMETMNRCPMPAEVIKALEATYEAPTARAPRKDSADRWVYDCATCRDSGLYSRDVRLKSGDVVGACGPCPDCSKGLHLAAAHVAREAEREGKFKAGGGE